MQSFEEIRQTEQENIMQTYGRFPVALVSGKNACVKDVSGRKYIDFTSGIGVNALGYSDTKWAAAVAKQARTLSHISNLYYSPVQVALAKMLCGKTGFSKVFFGNSGAEANECVIKLARKYSFDRYGEGRNEIVTLRNSFHGRTVTTLSATGQDVMHTNFFPFTEGFCYAPANDIAAVKKAITEKTCAVLLEFIQGEGGVLPLEQEFVKELFAYCREKDVLFLADEVQTGMGRTGTLFCYENYGVTPDAVTSAKGLGGGLPIGACLAGETLKDVLTPGTHGSTFGGNPVVCAGALEVIKRVSEKPFLREVSEKGDYLREKLSEMKGITGVRGMGMMLGASPEQGSAKEIAAACVKNGLLVLTAKDVLRFLPPLTITKKEIDAGLEILRRTLDETFA